MTKDTQVPAALKGSALGLLRKASPFEGPFLEKCCTYILSNTIYRVHDTSIKQQLSAGLGPATADIELQPRNARRDESVP